MNATEDEDEDEDEVDEMKAEVDEVAEIIKKFGTLGPLGEGGSLQSPWGSPRGAGKDAAESWTVVDAAELEHK